VRTKLLVLLACLVSAACAASAPPAAFTPTLATSTQEMTTTFNTSVAVEIKVPRDHDALFGGDLYVPRGYAFAGSDFPPGFVRGVANAQFAAAGTGATLRASGGMVVENPANFTTSPCAPGLHAAVWTLRLPAGGREFSLQLYMDETVGAARELGDYVVRFCAPTPDKLVSLQVNFRGHFRAPSSRGTYTWKLLATPWQGPSSSNADATVEARAEISLPAELRLRTSAKRRSLVVSGALTELGRPVVGQAVLLRVGARAQSVRTSTAGTFRVTAASGRRRAVVVWATAFVRTRDLGSCPPPSPAPQGCVSMTRAYYTINSRFVRVRIP
jgi:hypothetical protein